LTDTPRQQRTLARATRVDGFGLWHSRDATVRFDPAPPETGIVFVRDDLAPSCRLEAVAANRVEIPRRTTLAGPCGQVQMVEHVMAALAGLRIDNCLVRVDAEEMPGFDGSSGPVVAALQAAGIQQQFAPRRRLVVAETVRVGDERSWVEARPAERPGMFIQCRLDYGKDNAIGRQSYRLEVTPETFCRELATARTFLLKEEAEALRSQGLAMRATYQDVLVFGPDGPIENELRFDDECVRHKALDLVGDLALAGCDLHGTFVAHRSGHRLNAELVSELLQRTAGVQEKRSA